MAEFVGGNICLSPGGGAEAPDQLNNPEFVGLESVKMTIATIATTVIENNNDNSNKSKISMICLS